MKDFKTKDLLECASLKEMLKVWKPYFNPPNMDEVLREYGEACDTAVEFGIRRAGTTIALLSAPNLNVRSYDLEAAHYSPLYRKIREFVGARWECNIPADTRTLKASDLDGTDLLVVDSRHTYDQLQLELRHAATVRKFIAFHDVQTYARIGDDGREPGIVTAIAEFMEKWGWMFDYVDWRGPGLWVIRRP